MSYQLLVFDWDGTIMDSEAHIVAAVQAAAEECGFDVPHKDSVRRVIGLGLREAVQAVFPDFEEGKFQAFVNRYRHHFLLKSTTAQAPFDGAVETLNELRQAGFWLAVATGKGRQGLDRAMRELELESVFHTSRCADETVSKPHPRMLQEILLDLALEPQDALMIGDTSYDMEMAANIGMDRLAVSYGAHEIEDLEQHAPLDIIHDIRELPRWLARR
ncbi:MAG: HAD-IA family hydrolase [Gammaproteobacteria bacterium]|nr:HAD-IA family hydrolase [Gammaproteobacteria bacterium]